MKILLKNKQEADKVVNFFKDKTKDKKLRDNASMELYEKLQSPITSKIDKLEHTIKDTDLYERLINQNLLSIEPSTTNQAIEDKKQKTFKVDIFKDIDKDVISKYNIPTTYNSKNEIENVLKKVIPEKFKDNTITLTKITNENKRIEKEYNKKPITKERKNIIEDLYSKNEEDYANINDEQQELKIITKI